MSKTDDTPYIRHILDAIATIEDFLTKTPKQRFLSDKMPQNAIIKEIEIIGEAASRISAKTKQQSSHIPWEDIVNMRHRLIHGYFKINLETVWQAAVKDLPRLKTQVRALLKKL